MLTSVAFAQERCGADLFEKKALLKNPNQRADFELWMKRKIAERQSQSYARAKVQSTYRIPVVVHILHNGEDVGVGTNIPDAQVFSQISVLNEDYQRLNADASQTPAEFAGVASSLDIEFVLAKQDPDGLPTNGITRTLASKSGYNAYDDNAEIKAHDYWPSEDYLNIWVVNLIDDYLGVAQFPVTDLPGTTGPYTDLTDGVLIHYKAFGSKDYGSFNLSSKYDLGRTTTHEVGHYLGLLHVFGDFNGCGTTDYVDDTPMQSDRTFTCPSSPLTQCGHHVMFQNYLDYTDDACMNLFTAGQVERMQTVLDESPRRTTLSTSHGLNEPVVHNLDLEAKNVAAPMDTTCGIDIIPRVVIRNRGSTAVTSAKVSLTINGTPVETKTFAVSLGNFETTTLSFSPIDLAEPSSNTVVYQILEVNGTTDEDASNDATSLESIVKTRVSLPSLEAFNSKPINWQIVNTDKGSSWTIGTAPKATSSNKAIYVPFYDYENTSAKDQLISPFYNIPADNALLKFDHAYAMFPGVTGEALKVSISVGCSADLADAIEVYNESGTSLATAPTQQSRFIPTGESQWNTHGFSLAAYEGKVIRFIFEATNQHGNNLYLDNVALSAGDLNDIKIVSLVSPGPVFCEARPAPVIAVQNLGTQIVDDLQVTTTVNGVVNAVETLTGLAMTPGTLMNLTLESLKLSKASNEIEISVINPELSDDVPNNNEISFTRIFSPATDVIPIRQNFDENVANWTIYSEPDHDQWQGTTTNINKNSLVFKSFSNTNIGDESWFVSPVLDFTRASEGGLLFSTSYGRRLAASETLKVVVSKDCGITYDQVLFEKSGLDLANETVSGEWFPNDTSNWSKQYISLNDFAGKDNLRFAFVATNDNGNNLFLDNIEFFIEDNSKPPRIGELFTVYNSETNPYEFLITFNLPTKQDARLVVYNSVGQLLIDSQLPGTLNQTYTVNLYGQGTGIYVARLLTPSMTSSSKLFVGK